ncbi:MAG: alpha-L-rhamnosidase [Bryobacterales bacterium]|nr:alpha-L-rhamnosidase [Bryobacterales bacterium]
MLRTLTAALAASSLLRAGEAAHQWKAKWIDCPQSDPQAFGVYHFRKTFELPARPEHLVIFVSADNRYQLFVNGERVSAGPARSDLTHWRYEAVDIASQVHEGLNVLAAVVWNDGGSRAVAQVSNQTAFLVEAADPSQAGLNTDGRWKVLQDRAYSPQLLPKEQRTGYYALGPNEKVDGAEYPWGWERADFADSAWADARIVSPAAPRDARDAPNAWMLVRSEIPPEEQSPERELRVRQATGIPLPNDFPGRPLLIPPHSDTTLLLDQSYLTTSYPELTVSSGKASKIELHYAEALYDDERQKGNRNVIEEKRFLGPFDTYVSDGGDRRVYRPLFWRTYRYLKLHVETADEPLTVNSLRGVFSAYPFEKRAAFGVDEPSNEEVQRILGTGWRTARLCAHETYMDCPFYEQLQYAGDARIQMMVSLYMTGDSRLMKNGIALINSSRTAEGATYSRAPSRLQQYIPPFSLWWIGMVRDYWMYVDDPGFVRSLLPGVQAILSFYANYQKPNGSLARMPWWNFVDWVKEWPKGVPPADPDGSSSTALDLQLLMAYQWAAELEGAFGKSALAEEYRHSAAQLEATIIQTDWDESRGLFADQPAHSTYSQQVNTLAVLAHVTGGDQARGVVEKMLSDPSLAQSSIYFLAYTNATLREVGLGDRYLGSLHQWRDMLGEGLSTWAEENRPGTRSDCHAWGASPNFEFFRTIAGIESAAPGFKRVHISPNPGALKEVNATMPHPAGFVTVTLRSDRGKLAGEVALPEGTTGDFDWHGHRRPLHAGRNKISF